MITPCITLYGMNVSGHVHRVRAMLQMLELSYRYVETTAESRATPEYQALNAFGQVPVLQDGETVLADSNAILVYLAKRYASGGHWLPEDPVAAAEVQRWLSLAAGELRYGAAMARRTVLFGLPDDTTAAKAIAAKLFAFMDEHLAGREFLATKQPTIADLACYAYTARAPEGGVSIDTCKNVQAWLARIEALPRFLPMQKIEPFRK